MKINVLRSIVLLSIIMTTLMAVGCSSKPIQRTPGEEFPICTNSSDQLDPSISGDIVAWLDRRNNNSNVFVFDIYGYNLSSGQEFPVCIDAYEKSPPRIGSGSILWLEYPQTGQTVGAGSYDLSSGVAQVFGGLYPPESWGFNPVSINGEVITEQGQCGNIHCGPSNAKNLSICNQSNEPTCKVVSGDILIWQDRRNSNWDIFGYNSSSGQEFAVCTLPSDQSQPAIAGPILVWADERNGNSDIYGYNLSTGIEFPICTSAGNQTSPAISGTTVVWVDDRNGNADIYGIQLTFDNP